MFIGVQRDIVGSVIYKLIQNKPYVIGIQINGGQCRFFDQKIFQKIKKVMNRTLTKEN